MSVEEDLRATFVRHEAATPAADPLRNKIKAAVVRRKRRRAIISTAAAVLVVAAAVPIAASVSHRDSPTTESLLAAPVTAAAPATALNVLLIGTDRTPGVASARADSVTIVHVPVDPGATYLITLPRDGVVGGRTLAETFRAGGAPATRAAVSRLAGIKFNATIIVDPATLSAVTDAVDGVKACLGRRVEQNLPACPTFDGAGIVKRLGARSGLGYTGYERDLNSQRYLRSLAEKLTADGTLTDPAALRALVGVADHSGLKIDGDLSVLARAAQSLNAAEIVGVVAPSLTSTDSHHERVYPALFAALRTDDLATWTAAPRAYVER